jgi:hypothetical protein
MVKKPLKIYNYGEEMQIKIYKDTKIYIMAPSHTVTGGPELLHQLYYYLKNKKGANVYMYYYPTNTINPIPSVYKIYVNSFVNHIEDNSKNILISPEIYDAVSLLKNYKNIRKIIWWLSVDNFYTSRFSIKIRNFRLSYSKLLKNVDIKKDKYLTDIYLHLVQSEYAKQHLIKNGFSNIAYLSDYLNKSFLKQKFNINDKRNIISYNPSKGFKFTRRIIEDKSAKGLTFIPIKNMKREEVISLLKKTKVYIDFGNHPGKDRIPREAAILGCCVITNRKGSANYQKDIPIYQRYKVSENTDIPEIVNIIKDCLKNYKLRYKNFDNYRKVIKKEYKKFIKDADKIFICV